MRPSIALALAACGSSTPPPSDVDDVRADLPDPDPSYLDLVTPEFTIEPGGEVIYCYYVDNTDGTFGVDGVVELTGSGNHHLALRRATDPRPNGTFETCTSSADQRTRDLRDVFPGGGWLPPGWAVQIQPDTQFVVETHYLNATDRTLLARDVLRVHRVADVAMWVSSLALETLDLAVQPGEATLAFDCAAPRDLDVLQYWGHMHGLGDAFTAAVDGTTIYDVAHWQSDAVEIDTPLHVAAGAAVHVACSWRNTTGHVVVFPDEMCSFGGFVAGLDAFTCKAASYTP